MRADGRFEPALLFARDYPARARDEARAVEAGAAVVRWPGMGDASAPTGPAPRTGIARRLRHAVGRVSPRAEAALMDAAAAWAHGSVLSAGTHGRVLARQVDDARRAVTDETPAVLVLAEDSPEYASAALIAAAHERGIPAAVLPFTVPNPREPAETYARSRAHRVRGLSARWLAARRPQWVHAHAGLRLLRLPAGRALALERAGLAPPRPWALNSGRADVLLAESEAMASLYRAQGFPPDRLEVTGSLADDVLAAAARERDTRRRELAARLALPPHERLVLTALPPDQLGSRAARCAFPTYAALVTAWMEALVAPEDVVALVRPHPRETRTPPLAGHPRVRLVAEDTAALIPLADLYVASVSATIRWAVAAAVPAVNYDVYNYGYEDYDGLPGVIAAKDRAAFATALFDLRGDTLRAAARAQAEAAPRWGRLDGGSGRRVLDALGRLTEGR
jgi:hypothetical protein